MDYQMGGFIVFLFLLAVSLFSYFQSARHAEMLHRGRRAAIAAGQSADPFELR
jgi:hypothetical protein